MRLPDNAQSIQAGSASDCESGCLKNCSCTAYSYGSGGCSIWYGNLLNLQDQYTGPKGGTVSLRLAASELHDSKTEGPSLLRRKKIKEGVVIAPVVMGALTLLIITLLLTRKRMRRRAVTGKSKVAENGLVAFKFSELQRVTKNFSEKLGGGSFGSVFKGILSDSTTIAVKKLEGFKQGEKQFWSEVRTIGTTQHVNLVRLHGFCCERKQHLLVYEYMPNGSLDTKLFRNESNQVLDWNTRVTEGLVDGGVAFIEQTVISGFVFVI
ncbi:uncharacterized protein A4U43_C03F8850 [Asparagus officinalis]|uniref:non-specific serine/threonine protein kinase n=1 Tax=Asparagus officinalis TaxID=4686 RepID=A0A5P1FAA8_ASPOF|nr:uncharacterized protein A4U43_C03F8850 [Asparagus officinalis]